MTILSLTSVTSTGLAQVPWAEVGTVLPEDATIEQTIKLAGLDWEVLRCPTYVTIARPVDPEGTGLMLPYQPSDLDHQIHRVEDGFALIRADTGQTLSPHVGTRYKPVQNLDAFQVFGDFLAAGNMRMETAGTLSFGKHIWGLAKINAGFELCDGETIEGYFLLVQSHKYGHALRAMFTPVRYPGGHTMVRSLGNLSGTGYYRMPHSRTFNLTRIEEIKQVLTMARNELDAFRNKAEILANSKMDEPEAVRYLTEVFNPDLAREWSKDLGVPLTLDELSRDMTAGLGLRRAAKNAHDYPGSNLPSC